MTEIVNPEGPITSECMGAVRQGHLEETSALDCQIKVSASLLESADGGSIGSIKVLAILLPTIRNGAGTCG